MKNVKENKAITLIALVITIIVLLLLAGISISMLSGQDGILNKAAKAKNEFKESTIEEERNLEDLAAKLDGQEHVRSDNGAITLANGTGKSLSNYRIYGNTIEGESLGDKQYENLFDGKWIQKHIYDSSWDSRRVMNENLIPVKEGETYRFSTNTYNIEIVAVISTTEEFSVDSIIDDTKYRLGSLEVTASGDGYLALMCMYNNILEITPEDVKNYEFTLEKIENEDKVVNYKVPVQVVGKNLINEDMYYNLYASKLIEDTNLNCYDITVQGNTNGIAWYVNGVFEVGDKISAQAKVEYVSTAGYADSVTLRLWNVSKNVWIDAGINGYNSICSTIKVGETKVLKFNGIELTSDKYSRGDTIEFRVTRGTAANMEGPNEINYRVFKDSVMVEKSDAATDFEPYTESYITNIYLDEPLRKLGDKADYIDFKEQKIIRYINEENGVLSELVQPKEEKIQIPEILTLKGINDISIGTAIEPSKLEIYYK